MQEGHAPLGSQWQSAQSLAVIPVTYFQFHLLFNLPVSLVLLALNWGHWPEGKAVAEVLMAVMVFTSPWDNAAVRRGIWGFPLARTGLRIGWLPWEEYLFFIWQSINVIASVAWGLRVFPSLRTGLATPIGVANGIALILLLFLWVGIGLWMRKIKPAPRWNYAWHLLYWFLPVILGQWILAPGLFWALGPVLAGAAIGWGTYYTLADLVAVRAGVWFFDSMQITGHRLGGILPWEEIAFFYLTSLLVAQSYLLLLPPVLR